MKDMNLNLIVLASVIAISLAGPIYADTTDDKKEKPVVMKLHDCMQYAVDNSLQMKVSQADRNDEQALRRKAILEAFTPSLGTQARASNSYGRSLDPETNIYTNTSSFYNSYSVGAGIVLFNGFQAVNNIKIADVCLKMGKDSEQQTIDAICLATMEAYFNVLYYTELEKVLTLQVNTAEKSVQKAIRQEELGIKGHADVAEMQALLAKANYDLTIASNGKTDAMLTLKNVMFWPIDQELELKSDLKEIQETAITLANLTESAKMQLPKAGIASKTLQNAQTELSSARWAFSPRLDLYTGWETSYYTKEGAMKSSFNEQFKGNSGEYLSLSLEIPIWDRYSRRTRISQKKNALIRASVQYDQTMRDIENEVARAVNDRDGAKAASIQADALAESQEELFHLNSRRFEEGLISSIEYQTASQSWLSAQAERLGALYRYQIKNSVVLYYEGIHYLEQ